MSTIIYSGVEARARRAARRLGLEAKKSRWRHDSFDNQGGFTIIDPSINAIVAGERFDMTAQEVIDWCREQEAAA